MQGTLDTAESCVNNGRDTFEKVRKSNQGPTFYCLLVNTPQSRSGEHWRISIAADAVLPDARSGWTVVPNLRE